MSAYTEGLEAYKCITIPGRHNVGDRFTVEDLDRMEARNIAERPAMELSHPDTIAAYHTIQACRLFLAGKGKMEPQAAKFFKRKAGAALFC